MVKLKGCQSLAHWTVRIIKICAWGHMKPFTVSCQIYLTGSDTAFFILSWSSEVIENLMCSARHLSKKESPIKIVECGLKFRKLVEFFQSG